MTQSLGPYGRYQLLDLLGRGSVTEVFKAKSFGVEGFEKTLVVKRVLPELSAEADFVSVLVREAQLSVRLSHSGVVQVFDLGRVDEAVGTSFFMATELVQGLSLERLLARLQRTKTELPLGLALYIASEVAKALDHAHRRRDERQELLHIVHGDLSPSNVLISWEGEVKVSDFGIGRAFYALRDRAPKEAQNRKLQYASPEQVRGEPLTAASDLFSLGALTYTLLSGGSPFLRSSVTETATAIVQEPPPALPGLSPSLSELMLRLLAKEPAARGESAGHVYELLLGELYALGRVGAHELSELVEQLGDAATLEPPVEPTLALTSEVSGPIGLAVRGAAMAQGGSVTDRVGLNDSEDRPSGPYSSGRFGGVARVLEPTPDVPSAVAAASSGALAASGESRGTASALDGQEVSLLVLELPAAGAELSAARACEVVERYGARVLSGEARELVSVFGLGEADGRDTELAVRAGLVLRRSLGEEQALGLGVAAGRLSSAALSVSGASASGASASMSGASVASTSGALSTRVSEVPELAELLEGARTLARASRASQGALVLSQVAASHVGRLFELQAIPGEPGGFAVGEPRAPREAYGRFIGRQEELRRLGGVLAKASRRSLQVVGLVGEHGIGKTRLLYEMERRIERGDFNIRCHVAECVPSGRSLPYSAVVAMLRALCGVREGDAPERVAAVEPRLRAAGLQDQEVAVVLTELGLSRGERVATGGVLTSALARMLGALSKDQLHVFSWDNAQDIDAASVELLARVAERLARARLILLFSARPREGAAYRELPGYQEIALVRLDDDDVYRLICVRLGVREVPEALFEFIQERCSGHPMFVEEVLREAVSAGAVVVEDRQVVRLDLSGALSVPRPLRSLVGDRIRRLDDPERRLIIATAILGSPADTSVLSAMLDVSPGSLNRSASLLTAEKLMLRDGPVSLSFPSPLIGEVVLASISVDQAAELHSAAADAYRLVLGERTEQEASRVAYHLARAGARDRAAGFYATSGMYQLTARRLEHAASDLTQALSLADWDARGSDQLAEWVHALVGAIRHVRSGEGLAELVRRLAARVEQDPNIDPTLRLRVSVDLALSLGALHRYKEARQLLSNDKLERSVTESGSQEARRAFHAALGEICFHQGDFRAALDAVGRAQALGPSDGVEQHRLLLSSAQALAGAGELQAATDALSAASALLPAEDDAVLHTERAKVRALIRAFQRDWGGAALAAEQAAELGREAGLNHEVAVNLHNQGDSLMRLGELPRAYAALQKSLEVAETIGSERMVNLNRMMLAYLDALGGSTVARRVLGERLATAEAQRWTWDVITGRYLLGKLLAAQGDSAGGRRELTLAHRLAEDSKNRLLAEDCREELAALGS
ncbi:MAG: protein kinase [Polyangiaceae bacterium]|nr:protein kinase [Polyangiaceae bacterium]MCW5789668.1 protein kinase [Polyangiaceae bacterium]